MADGVLEDRGGWVAILDAGRATLELSDVPHAEHIDRRQPLRAAWRVNGSTTGRMRPRLARSSPHGPARATNEPPGG